MSTLPPLKSVIERFGLDARKSLGQHFLLDANITARIARAAGNLKQGTTIEIGPGPGGLTRSLLEAGAQVLAVEKDSRCIAALAELGESFPGKLEVLESDAMKVRLQEIATAPRRIVANLPYNVGTALLVQWLEEVAEQGVSAYESMTLMFQKEVAERIAAAPGSKDYGRLSVFAQWLCETVHQFDLPPGAFSPPPKVHSSVITLTPRAQPLYPARKELLERVLAVAFNQRRKMLRVSLKALGVDTAMLLKEAGVAEEERPEQLDVAAFCALARALEKQL